VVNRTAGSGGVRWRAAGLLTDAPHGLQLLQVRMTATGQNWLTVRTVEPGSTADFKKVLPGMMLFRVAGRCVAGLTSVQLQELDDILETRPLALEFAIHVDGLQGDWRYEQVTCSMHTHIV
jgi:hypothetical protein